MMAHSMAYLVSNLVSNPREFRHLGEPYGGHDGSRTGWRPIVRTGGVPGVSLSFIHEREHSHFCNIFVKRPLSPTQCPNQVSKPRVPTQCPNQVIETRCLPLLCVCVCTLRFIPDEQCLRVSAADASNQRGAERRGGEG